MYFCTLSNVTDPTVDMNLECVHSVGILRFNAVNSFLRKYSGNRNAKKVSKVKLTLPARGIRFSHEDRTITIPSLKLELEYQFRNDFENINQIELDSEFAYISVTVSTILPQYLVGD